MSKYLLIFVSLTFCSCRQNGREQEVTVSIKSLVDSTELGFSQVYLFRKGAEVLDTFSDLDGKITLDKNVEGIAIRAAAHYPVYRTRKEVLIDSIVYLEESRILVETGGMGEDSLLMEINEDIEKRIATWNQQISK